MSAVVFYYRHSEFTTDSTFTIRSRLRSSKSLPRAEKKTKISETSTKYRGAHIGWYTITRQWHAALCRASCQRRGVWQPRCRKSRETPKKARVFPKNLFGLVLTSEGYFNFPGHLKSPQKMHCKTRVKRAIFRENVSKTFGLF